MLSSGPPTAPIDDIHLIALLEPKMPELESAEEASAVQILRQVNENTFSQQQLVFSGHFFFFLSFFRKGVSLF